MKPTTKPTKWSDWAESLPSEINSSNSEIETKAQYSYCRKNYIESTAESSYGILEKREIIYGDWSDWSEYSDTEVTASNNVEVRTRKMYR